MVTNDLFLFLILFLSIHLVSCINENNNGNKTDSCKCHLVSIETFFETKILNNNFQFFPPSNLSLHFIFFLFFLNFFFHFLFLFFSVFFSIFSPFFSQFFLSPNRNQQQQQQLHCLDQVTMKGFSRNQGWFLTWSNERQEAFWTWIMIQELVLALETHLHRFKRGQNQGLVGHRFPRHCTPLSWLIQMHQLPLFLSLEKCCTTCPWMYQARNGSMKEMSFVPTHRQLLHSLPVITDTFSSFMNSRNDFQSGSRFRSDFMFKNSLNGTNLVIHSTINLPLVTMWESSTVWLVEALLVIRSSCELTTRKRTLLVTHVRPIKCLRIIHSLLPFHSFTQSFHSFTPFPSLIHSILSLIHSILSFHSILSLIHSILSFHSILSLIHSILSLTHFHRDLNLLFIETCIHSLRLTFHSHRNSFAHSELHSIPISFRSHSWLQFSFHSS